MKKMDVFAENGFKDATFSNFLVHESEFMKIINFNFRAGQTLPVHSHDIEGELTITVLHKAKGNSWARTMRQYRQSQAMS